MADSGFHFHFHFIFAITVMTTFIGCSRPRASPRTAQGAGRVPAPASAPPPSTPVARMSPPPTPGTSAVAAAYATPRRGGLLEPEDDDAELARASRGALYKRKDFLGKEKGAQSHPNPPRRRRRHLPTTTPPSACRTPTSAVS